MRNCYNFNMKPFDLRLWYEGLKRYLLTNENTNSKLQVPNIGLCGSDERGRILGNRLSLEFWICLRFVIWSLELNYWRLIKSFIPKSAIEWRGDPDGCEKI